MQSGDPSAAPQPSLSLFPSPPPPYLPPHVLALTAGGGSRVGSWQSPPLGDGPGAEREAQATTRQGHWHWAAIQNRLLLPVRKAVLEPHPGPEPLAPAPSKVCVSGSGGPGPRSPEVRTPRSHCAVTAAPQLVPGLMTVWVWERLSGTGWATQPPGGTWEPPSQSAASGVSVRVDGSLQSAASVSASRKPEAPVVRTSEKFL